MKVTYSSVFTCKEYNENGENKKTWYRIGYLKEKENGGRFLNLFQFPDTEFFIFEDEEQK